MELKERLKKDVDEWLEKIGGNEKDIPYFCIQRKDKIELVTPKKIIEALSKSQLNFYSATMVKAWGGEALTTGELIDPWDLEKAKEKGCDLVLEQFKLRLERMTEKEQNMHVGAWDGTLITWKEMYQLMKDNNELGQAIRRIFERLYYTKIEMLG